MFNRTLSNRDRKRKLENHNFVATPAHSLMYLLAANFIIYANNNNQVWK